MTPLINPIPLGRFSGQPDLLRRLIEIYFEIAPETLAKIDSAVAARDSEQIAWHAHSLKGSSADLGADQLAGLCQQLQVTAKADDLESAASLAADLNRCYRETATALESLEFS